MQCKVSFPDDGYMLSGQRSHAYDVADCVSCSLERNPCNFPKKSLFCIQFQFFWPEKLAVPSLSYTFGGCCFGLGSYFRLGLWRIYRWKLLETYCHGSGEPGMR